MDGIHHFYCNFYFLHLDTFQLKKNRGKNFGHPEKFDVKCKISLLNLKILLLYYKDLFTHTDINTYINGVV